MLMTMFTTVAKCHNNTNNNNDNDDDNNEDDNNNNKNDRDRYESFNYIWKIIAGASNNNNPSFPQELFTKNFCW